MQGTMCCNTEMGCLFLQKFFLELSKFPHKTLRSDFCYSSLVSVMMNKAYRFTVEDNGIYYKDRHLVHKRNSSFEFGEIVSSIVFLFEEKKSNNHMVMTRALSLHWTPRGRGGDGVIFRWIDVHLSTMYPLSLLFLNSQRN